MIHGAQSASSIENDSGSSPICAALQSESHSPADRGSARCCDPETTLAPRGGEWGGMKRHSEGPAGHASGPTDLCNTQNQ